MRYQPIVPPLRFPLACPSELVHITGAHHGVLDPRWVVLRISRAWIGRPPGLGGLFMLGKCLAVKGHIYAEQDRVECPGLVHGDLHPVLGISTSV